MVTSAQINEAINTFNANSENFKLKRMDRNGHYGVDLYSGEKCIRNIGLGTKREVLDAIHEFISNN